MVALMTDESLTKLRQILVLYLAQWDDLIISKLLQRLGEHLDGVISTVCDIVR